MTIDLDSNDPVLRPYIDLYERMKADYIAAMATARRRTDECDGLRAEIARSEQLHSESLAMFASENRDLTAKLAEAERERDLAFARFDRSYENTMFACNERDRLQDVNDMLGKMLRASVAGHDKTIVQLDGVRAALRESERVHQAELTDDAVTRLLQLLNDPSGPTAAMRALFAENADVIGGGRDTGDGYAAALADVQAWALELGHDQVDVQTANWMAKEIGARRAKPKAVR